MHISYHTHTAATYRTCSIYTYGTTIRVYGMEIHTIWVYGDMKAAEAQRYYRLLKRCFSLVSAIYHSAEVFEMGALHGTSPYIAYFFMTS